MKINITAGFTGVISTGPYENMRPSFGCSIEYTVPDDWTQEQINAFVAEKEKELYENSAYQNFKQAESKAVVEKINKERGEFRFYYDDDGSPLPSVTSILSVDKDWLVDAAKLRLLAAESQLRHALLHEWIATKKMPESAKDIKGVFTDYIMCEKAGIKVDGHGVLGFFDKHRFTGLLNGTKVINKEHRYGGTPDCFGAPEATDENKKVDILPVKSIADAKRTPDFHENMIQMAMYLKALPKDHPYYGSEQMIVIPLNDKTKQGFSKPLVSRSVDKYFEIGLQKRADFKKRYGA